MLNLMTWGFLQNYANASSNRTLFVGGALVSGLLLWEVLFRGQIGFSMSFLEEIWSRNLGNLLMSPLRPMEFVAALMIMSLARLFVGLLPTTILAVAFFGFDLAGLGIGLVAFFALLVITGWAVGLVVAGLILRHGLGAESLAWTIMFVFWPLCCVYYPLSALPVWLKPFALALPPTYVFEGMRAVLAEGVLRTDLLAAAAGLNVIWFVVASWAFVRLLNSARAAGSLLSSGE
ncbi:ABC transporter permease [Phreatobacter aquaticus]|uniref:ABC transporter permease n=2 Tax=Phreatobacter aquaticus TaxID=2570229 RepID=A0A4D7QRP6_9HYPH|nr:ABC transporter permease [Phreatobacter aquaticus]